MKLEDTILECYKDYKSVVDSNPDEWITFKEFTNYYKKGENGEWEKTKEKNSKKNKLKTDGTYYNSIYRKNEREKTRLPLEDWLVEKLPKEIREEAKFVLDKKLQEKKYYTKIYDEYKNVVENNPNEWITFSGFTLYYKKDENDVWKKTEEKRKTGTALKTDGTYADKIYRKHRNEKIKQPLEDWFIAKLPQQLQEEAKETLDEKLQEQKYYTKIYNDYKSVITQNPDEWITFTQFVQYFKKNENEIWKKTGEKKPGTNALKRDGTYHNPIYKKYEREKRKLGKPIDDWFITQLPQEMQSEATYYLKGGYLTDRLKALK